MFSYYSAVTFFAVFFMFIMILLIKCNDLLEKKQKNIFYHIAGIVIACSISEWMGVWLNGAPDWTRIPHIIVKVIEFSLVPMLSLSCVAILNGVGYIKRFLPVVFIHLFVEILSGIWGFIFYVDSANIYQHGPFYWIYALTYIVSTIFFAYHAFKISEKYYGMNKLVLWSILIFMFCGIVIQQINNFIRVDWLCVSIDVLLFYIFYSELMQQSDAITSLLNRRSYDSRIARMKEPAVVLIFDIDDFKLVNDSYGHSFGDYCLEIVGSKIHESYEKIGRCYRIGGDEFSAILNISEDQVEKYNTILFNSLNEERKNEPRIPFISVGYSVFDPADKGISDSIKEADDMMYSNKKRNKCSRKHNN